MRTSDAQVVRGSRMHVAGKSWLGGSETRGPRGHLADRYLLETLVLTTLNSNEAETTSYILLSEAGFSV